MKVSINHLEKKAWLIRKTTHYGVSLTVAFSPEEAAIIKERDLYHDVVLERDYPSDMSDSAIEKHSNRGLGKKLLTAAVSGAEANHFHLTISKLLKGEDVYFLRSPIEAKGYEEALKDALVNLKGYILGNAEVEEKASSFEL
jgi:hypothetical protein